MAEKSLYAFEEEYWKEGFSLVVGIDEAGRGPLAGPVVAGAVILPAERIIPGLNDSKQLTAKKRDSLFVEILELCQVGVGLVSEREIDTLNIFQAARLAMKKAVLALGVKPEVALVDGNMKLDLACPAEDIIHGDCLSASIAAASIVAKVIRDRVMLAYDQAEPRFSFAKHKGYGTEEHLAALTQWGPTPYHRHSFRPICTEDSFTRKPSFSTPIHD